MSTRTAPHGARRPSSRIPAIRRRIRDDVGEHPVERGLPRVDELPAARDEPAVPRVEGLRPARPRPSLAFGVEDLYSDLGPRRQKTASRDLLGERFERAERVEPGPDGVRSTTGVSPRSPDRSPIDAERSRRFSTRSRTASSTDEISRSSLFRHTSPAALSSSRTPVSTIPAAIVRTQTTARSVFTPRPSEVRARAARASESERRRDKGRNALERRRRGDTGAGKAPPTRRVRPRPRSSRR